MAEKRRIAGRTSAVHSVRCTDDLWARATRRAKYEGLSMNAVITEILEGYATGRLNMPTVTKTYSQPTTGGE